MAYIDIDYYRSNYYGESIPEEEFDYLAEAASWVVDILTYGRAKHRTAEKFVSAIKTATAIETEYLYLQGGKDAISGRGDNLKISEDIGNYRYEKNAETLFSVGGIAISPLCLAVLDSVGLRFSGV